MPCTRVLFDRRKMLQFIRSDSFTIMSFRWNVLFVFSLLCILTSVRCLNVYDDDPTRQDHTQERGLTKRAISRQAAKGLAVAKQLLTDARRVPTRARNFRKYFKTGTPDSALAEFYSINPSNVRERKTFDFSRNYAFGHNALVGQAGDRVLILKLKGDKYSKGRPVLEVREATKERYDRIVYKLPTE